MKRLIIYGSYVPEGKEEIGRDILNRFKNDTIYIGVNPASKMWNSMVADYPHEITPPELLLDSDASAYQSALRAYVNSGDETKYDYALFVHNKGITSGAHQVREHHLAILNHDNISRAFEDPAVGTYGATLTLVCKFSQMQLSPWWEMDKWSYSLPWDPLPLFYMSTMYAIRFAPFKDFLDWRVRGFLRKNLKDRYFFERDFCQAIWRQSRNYENPYIPATHELCNGASGSGYWQEMRKLPKDQWDAFFEKVLADRKEKGMTFQTNIGEDVTKRLKRLRGRLLR